MNLIIESGSTKSDWVFVQDNGSVLTYTTTGINPITQAKLDLNLVNTEIQNYISQTKKIWYYGAGVANHNAEIKVEAFLKDLGATAPVRIHSDLLGAARGICGNNPGIICILGTGSNAGVYAGGHIVFQKPSLGYILGDEGGGVAFGKALLTAYFYGTMPQELAILFEEKYALTKDILLSKIYGERQGSSYIASFASFLSDIDHSWKTSLSEKIFIEFIQLRILPLLKQYSYPVSFTGSVAYSYRDILLNLLKDEGIQTGKIVQKPIEGLIEYHIKEN